MAIVFKGISPCSICNNVLDDSKEFILIPPLISNVLDELSILSDSGVHLECINKSELRNKLQYHLTENDKRFPMSSVKCMIDNKPVTDPPDLVSFGLLTSNESEELYKFNHLNFNKKNISKWKEKDAFISIAEKFLLEGKWKGLAGYNYLENTLNLVKANC